MKAMKKLAMIITVVVLMLNIISVDHEHAHASDTNHTQTIEFDDHTDTNNTADTEHYTHHHHCDQSLVSKTNSSEFFSVYKESYSWDNTINYSQLNFPPSKPPRA